MRQPIGTIEVMHRRPSIALWALGVGMVLSACGSSARSGTAEPETNDGRPGAELAVDDDVTVTASSATTGSSTTATAPPTSNATPETTASPSTTIVTVPIETIGLELELVSTFTSPVAVAVRPETDDLYVVEQRGRIVRLPGGSPDGADVALDLRGDVSLGNEQGLLGLVFAPDGDDLYVDYTDEVGTTTIARYVMAGPVADAESAEVLLTIPQPRGNHNGGQLAFGPDGYLYIGLGDGGGAGDPDEHGQNPDTLLGSILRIDVSGPDGYAIPSDNPFPNGQAPEVFLWGIRNAWRFAFDPVTGDLWIGDVGQDRFEEVTVLRGDDGGGNGANLGWNEVEGDEPFRGGTAPAEHVAPVITYAHIDGRCSITGGEVYRGESIPALRGTYLYGDFCTGEVFGYRVDDSAEPVRLDLAPVDRLSSFGVDGDGEPVVVSRSGGLFRIVAG